MGTHEELRALGGRYASMWDAFELTGYGAQDDGARDDGAQDDGAKSVA
jgi:hypothetical protein